MPQDTHGRSVAINRSSSVFLFYICSMHGVMYGIESMLPCFFFYLFVCSFDCSVNIRQCVTYTHTHTHNWYVRSRILVPYPINTKQTIWHMLSVNNRLQNYEQKKLPPLASAMITVRANVSKATWKWAQRISLVVRILCRIGCEVEQSTLSPSLCVWHTWNCFHCRHYPNETQSVSWIWLA